MVPGVRPLLDLRIAHLQRRERLAECLSRLCRWWTVGLLAVATVVLLQRLALPGWGSLIPPLVALALLLPLVRLPQAWRQRERSQSELAAHLDLLCDTQGLAMALGEQPAATRDPDWTARLRRPLEGLRLPPVDRRGPILVGIATLTLAAACLLPQREADPVGPGVAWKDVFAPARRDLAEAERDGLLPRPEVERIKRQIDVLAAGADESGMSQARWEALERIEHRLQGAGADALDELAATLVQADRLRRAGETELPADTAALAERLGELARRRPGLTRELAELARQFRAGAGAEAQGGEPDGGRAQHDRARDGRDGERLARRLRRLDPDAQRRLAARLDECLREQAAHLGLEGLDGLDAVLRRRGYGVERGPGHVALDFSRPEVEAETGEGQGLPPGAAINPDGSITLSQRQREAEIDTATERELVRARARRFGAEAVDARRARIAPRHRATVAGYFKREAGHRPAEETEAP